MPLELGKTFDRYTVEALVGEGGMGAVYRAFDTRLRRHVALKVLHPAKADGGRDTIVNALREARAAAAITHPNATATFDADEVQGTSFIVMEFVRGTSLRRFVGDPLPSLALRLRWLVEVAGALAAAHQVGIVHRDIKPENVMVRDDGIIKVLDFGVARRTGIADSFGQGEDDDHRGITHSGKLVGTPAYMAPEQIRGDDIDGRADQFAWGVLGYELLTGHVPWNAADNFLGCLAAVLTEAPALPSSLVPDIPIGVEAAILRALAKDPDDRFPSMAEAAAELSPLGQRDARVRAPSIIPPTPMGSNFPPSDPASAATLAIAHAPVPQLKWSDSEPPVERGSAPPSSAPPRSAPQSAPFSRPSGLAPRVPSVLPEDNGPAFREPNFIAPVDLHAHIRRLPADATCKGMFFADLLQRTSHLATTAETLRVAGLPDRRYIGFRDYPMADCLCLGVATAKMLYPNEPLGEGLRRIGQTHFATVLGSHVGRSVLGVLGADFAAVLLSAPKAFKLLVNFGEIATEQSNFRTFFLRARGFPVFLETFHIGAIEGVLEHCNERARLRVHVEDLATATIEIRLI